MPRSKNKKSEAAWESVGLTVKGNKVLLCSSIVGVDTSHACSRKGVGEDKTMFPAVSFIHCTCTSSQEEVDMVRYLCWLVR